MSRSGYSDDLEQWELIRYRGAVASALRGARGQRFLSDLIGALDAMPRRRLITQELQDTYGEVCALGAVILRRGLDPVELQRAIEDGVPDAPWDETPDPFILSRALDIARALAAEVAYKNDEHNDYSETPEARWLRIRDWASSHLRA